VIDRTISNAKRKALMQTEESMASLLIHHPFLAGLDPRLHEFFDNCGTLRRFGSGQQIFHEGSEADHFYLILNGEVALETFVPGCGMVTIQRLGSGDSLGWSWLFPPHEWHFTATTAKPTEVISLDAASLREAADKDLEFRAELMSRIAFTLVQRLQGTRMQLVDLYGIRP
jgi:CRP/FNR family cyclic AMP-dependent transcriptional regulator